MPIIYNEKERIFRLETPHSTYLIAVVDDEGFLGHVYYGRKIPDDNMTYLLRVKPEDYPSVNNRERMCFQDMLPMEYPGHGLGDLRESCLRLETHFGSHGCCFTYQSHRIYGGKPKLDGLPATYGTEKDCTTLELIAEDQTLGLRVCLYYTAFEHLDVICRSVKIENTTESGIRLISALSTCLDMDNQNFDMISLHGNWSVERMISRARLTWGKHAVSSFSGVSSNRQQPFIALAEHTATQSSGQVYAMNFVYSGNFLGQVEMNQQDQLRMVMGINPTDFCWNLEPGESFQTPEVVMVYSNSGIGGMTRTFHDLYREHLIRGPYKDKARPSLVNNWEATYFRFDARKILEIGAEAVKAGIEMLVLDDGWFGRRDDDTSSLGDWYVYQEKLPGGLGHLVEQLNKMGLRFGLWFEPEMISPDSDLYRAHPDYALQIPGREPTQRRGQLVLDMSRQDVRDCVYRQIYQVLSSANIEYVKWDMNRELTDVYSSALSADAQGELFHRYVLGVYEIQERMLRDFPNLLLENCSSGGRRFDPGMLYYSPQIWTSDNTEAIDRLKIQEGTALVYPLSSMGAHVAACPSHTNGRVTPFETRGRVSLVGSFGYELDLTRLSEEEKAMIPDQLEEYRKYGPVFRTGDYYRLASYAENHEYDAVLAVSKDQKVAVLDYVQVVPRRCFKEALVHPDGLKEEKYYCSSLTGEIRSGAGWMYGGILLPRQLGDYQSGLIILEEVSGESIK